MRALVTGGNGFVGRHLVAALRARGDEVIVAGHPDDEREIDLPLECARRALRVRGVGRPRRAPMWSSISPRRAAVPASIADPLDTYEVNIGGTARLCEALRATSTRERAPLLLFASSGDIYGRREPHEYPVDESLAPRPSNPYAASKVAGEAVVLAAWRSFGLRTIVTRAFNHLGPGQDERFVAATFARQLARIASGATPTISVGDLETQRDFLDVRDVVDAYLALAARRRRRRDLQRLQRASDADSRDLTHARLDRSSACRDSRGSPSSAIGRRSRGVWTQRETSRRHGVGIAVRVSDVAPRSV